MTASCLHLAVATIGLVGFRLIAGSDGNTKAVAVSEHTQPPGTATLSSRQTLVYKTIGNTAIRADVYRLPGDEPRPAIVWIHPGALIMGSRDMLPEDERERFLKAGYVVVAIDYRLAPETKLPEILKDVDDAHRWVRETGSRLFHVDPERVATVGASGGAYLALMAGARVQPKPRAVVSFYGYGDIAGPWYSRPDPFYLTQPRVAKADAYKAVGTQELSESPATTRGAFYTYCRQNGLWPREVVGLDPDTDADAKRLAAYSPERLATPAYPPTLLLHGDKDVDVPFEMSERMADALKGQGVAHGLYRLEGFNHAFDVFSVFPPQGPPSAGLKNPKVATAFEAVIAFLDEHLRR
jgi:acetyl esterase/lipase